MKSRFSKKKDTEKNESIKTVSHFEPFKKSTDFICFPIPSQNPILHMGYYHSLIDAEILHRDILPFINRVEEISIDKLLDALPVENMIITEEKETIQTNLLKGYVMICSVNEPNRVILIKAGVVRTRQVSLPEVEFSVVGPKEALVESLDTNMNLVRKRLPIPELIATEVIVGKLSKTRVAVLYIEGITNEENVNTMIQRLRDLEVNQINDSSYITQLIQDNNNSIFPQFVDTERPDRLAAVLAEGKIVILTDGSPSGLIGPTTLVEFFSAFEDYFLNWLVASFFRLVRVFSVIFSILVTPIYVAVLTYHYELIPKDLINTLVTSRSGIPLPPILEALTLELAIELLREAGARLPTKVGQTIGIVGGIVIGTASVEAGLTSTVLLIIVALAALASFTTPVYQMGNTIRLIRFPFLIFAHVLGLIGVSICTCFLLIHLLKLTSLGRPYLEPIYPPRFSDLKDAMVRLPFSFQSKRPIELQAEDTMRYDGKSAKEKDTK
ncbi:spore germination protein [Falsibacillus pallidus]|uniref:GerA spore germination protein n=1 Tax=Falsibacillus pallidus TaxID=493781 RepID=A0A370G7K5_9BACI|nr:spore germination protein [Falsibacillus pallidus]RDI38003.1 GerA spore germination protein [Falsibacillus pallidus]